MSIEKLILETERLNLKRSDERFVDIILDFNIRNKDFLSEFEPKKHSDYYTVDYHKQIIEYEINKIENGTLQKFYIFEKDNAENIIGSIALSNIVMGGFLSCFLGYKMDKDKLNRGYMTEAIKRVIRYSFSTIGLHRIEANIMPRNKQSIRVVEKLGFINEGLSKRYLNINGTWEDHIHMVLLNENLE